MTGGHDTRVSLAALIAVRPDCRPRLIYRTHRARRGDTREGFTETDYARLLDAAHQQLNGAIVLVWDNLNTHRSGAMTELIAARDWLTVFRLPPYASELNPVEPVWPNLKRSLANLTNHDIDELTALVKTRLRRMQYRPGLLEGFLARPGLDLAPLQQPSQLKIVRRSTRSGCSIASSWATIPPRVAPATWARVIRLRSSTAATSSARSATLKVPLAPVLRPLPRLSISIRRNRRLSEETTGSQPERSNPRP